MSGYNLGRLGSYGNYAWVIPILAGLTILVGFVGVSNRWIGAITGIVPIGGILYAMLRLDLKHGGSAAKEIGNVAGNVLSVGAWLTIILSIAIIFAALVKRTPAEVTAGEPHRQADQMPPDPKESGFDRLEALERLARLKEKGAINEREFLAEKDKILNVAKEAPSLRKDTPNNA